MKNCIFICVFKNIDYVNLLYLLLESIFIYGNLSDDTDILIYTSTEFMNMIKDSSLFHKSIKFEINDTYDSVVKACCSRLDLFSLPSVDNYNRILYLDTDILIKGDINKVFKIVEKDILYVLEEGTITDECWGNFLFKETMNNYPDKSAFTSGILLFNKCDKIKELFENINKHMSIDYIPSSCIDQPYIVYNAFKYDLFDNKKMMEFVVNNDFNINSDKVIHHFPGGPGNYSSKIVKMMGFFNRLKDYTIMTNINNAKEYIDQNLLPIINECGEPLEGNIFMLHHTTSYTNRYLLKAKNISNLVLNKNVKSVMEIGFNSGFSSLLMLLSNPNIKINCFDLGEHSYTLPCFIKLRETFGNRISLAVGDSTKTLPYHIDETYDLIHIDGGHATEVAESDIFNSYKLSKDKTVLIMDDYDFHNLHELWDRYIIKYSLKPLNINVYNSPHHDVKYIVNK
jgi:predicted O-methyltransferase YrrM